MRNGTTIIIVLILTFNWLAPLDEKCIGSRYLDSDLPSVECFDYEHGVVEYDVRLG